MAEAISAGCYRVRDRSAGFAVQRRLDNGGLALTLAVDSFDPIR